MRITEFRRIFEITYVLLLQTPFFRNIIGLNFVKCSRKTINNETRKPVSYFLKLIPN